MLLIYDIIIIIKVFINFISSCVFYKKKKYCFKKTSNSTPIEIELRPTPSHPSTSSTLFNNASYTDATHSANILLTNINASEESLFIQTHRSSGSKKTE